MITRSGASYRKEITHKMAEEGELTMAKVLKALLDDRQLRGKEQ